MSDCSTQAMKPKERRTCGNCNNCDFFDMECSYIEEDGTHRKVTMDTPACADWERRVLTDEERYEHLAQVAREMFWCVRDPLDFAERTGEKYTRDGHYYFTEIFAEQLEALGVSVDD